MTEDVDISGLLLISILTLICSSYIILIIFVFAISVSHLCNVDLSITAKLEMQPYSSHSTLLQKWF